MLGKSGRHIRRYKEIAKVMLKHDLGWILVRSLLVEFTGKGKANTPTESAPIQLREALEELGPTFVKLGQLLSTRPDIIPDNYIKELVKLQDTALLIPLDQIHEVIRQEFETEAKELYASFDNTPMAAASIAQVHAAVLHDGTPVIAKIQRPNIREQIETDIEILYNNSRFLEDHWDRAKIYGVTDIVDEFAVVIREELDYTREARNTDRIREALANTKGVHVPKVHWSLTTNKVLTLELMTGNKINDVIRNPLPGVSNKDLAVRVASIFLEQIFVHRFFHADPHPGNLLVSKTGDIELLDCGQVGMLDAESSAGATRMLLAFDEQNSRAFADEVLSLGIAQEDVDIQKFSRDISRLLRSFYDLPSRAINVGSLFAKVLEVSASHKVRLPAVFAVLGKMLASIDGICRQLDQDFNFTDLAKMYVSKAVKGELRGESTLTEIYRALVGMRNLFFTMPEQIEKLVRKAVEGTLRIEFKHQGLEEVSDVWEKSTNRISLALIVGSIIVGSSLVINTSTGPTSWFGLPTIGIIGYLLASIFGLWLMIQIILSGRQK